MEAVAGLGAVVLAILGLLGLMPFALAAIGVIVVSAALLLEGGSVGARASRLYGHATSSGLPAEVTGGVSSELFAAIGGLALGILALLGILPYILMPVAIIVLGAALLLGSAATSRLSATPIGPESHVLRESVYAASGAHVLVGIGAIVLGILALLGISPLSLVLVAELALGATIVLSGAAMGGRVMSVLHHG
jgi:hypothetical protein